MNAAVRTAQAINAPTELTKDERTIRHRFKLAQPSRVMTPDEDARVWATLAKAERIARRAKRKV